jgi:hypothetical protein
MDEREGPAPLPSRESHVRILSSLNKIVSESERNKQKLASK